MDYLAPSWALRFDASGKVMNEYDVGEKFLGYADGFAYLTSRFGDGGGYNMHIYAVNVNEGTSQRIYGLDAMIASEEKPDPMFVPKKCTILKTDSLEVMEDIKVLTAQTGLKSSEITLGIPCSTEGLHIFPFTVPDRSKYGVAVRKTDGSLDINLRWAGTGASVYPPTYTDSDLGSAAAGLELMYVIASKENGEYTYNQQYYWAGERLSTEAYFTKYQDIDFCRIHACVKEIMTAKE